jgi:hypothetical protein
VAASADPAQARHHELKVGFIAQQSPVWCWAASASMALKYLGFPDINEVKNYQCGVVAAAFPDCEDDCTQCDVALDRMPSFVTLLDRYRDRTSGGPIGVRARFSPNYVAYPDFDQIKRSIDLSYPVIGGISLGEKPADPALSQHAVLITGYDDNHLGSGEPWVTILDPYPYSRGESPWASAGYRVSRSARTLTVPWRFVRDRMNLTSAVFLEKQTA